MKVRELILLLNQCDPNDPVALEWEDDDLRYDLVSLYNDRGTVVLTDASLTR
jgi:hypothetical protein